jgi:hypothetical protein
MHILNSVERVLKSEHLSVYPPVRKEQHENVTLIFVKFHIQEFYYNKTYLNIHRVVSEMRAEMHVKFPVFFPSFNIN